MTDSNLLSYLKKHEINFVLHEHEAMHTMDDVVELQSVLQGPIPKNLFLKSNKNNFYLVSMVGSKKLDIKSLKKKLEVSELSFASEEELKNYLNLKPGSVSIFGVINVEPEQKVTVILDSDLYNAPWVSFHPNLNTETIELNHLNFTKFWKLIYQSKLILDL